MSVRKFDQMVSRISEDLSRLSPDKVAVFCASCSERFIGLYEEFAEKSQWGIFHLVTSAFFLSVSRARTTNRSGDGLNALRRLILSTSALASRDTQSPQAIPQEAP